MKNIIYTLAVLFLQYPRPGRETVLKGKGMSVFIRIDHEKGPSGSERPCIPPNCVCSETLAQGPL